MRLPANQVHSVKSLAAFYSRRPHRIRDIVRWAQHRHKSTLELRLPWWNYPAIDAVMAQLPCNARVFEYGGGGSTLWLNDLGARLTSVEHDPEWYAVLRDTLPAECIVVHRPASDTGSIGSESTPGVYYDDYVRAIDTADDDSLDLVIVDGRARVECVAAARHKVADGGLLLLDDSDRYQYRLASKLLAGWSRTDYRGAKPGGGGVVQTTVWRRGTA